MKLSELKEQFLSIMGITTWQLKNKEEGCEYLLLLAPEEARPNAEKKALMERLIDAIDWPHEATQHISFDKEMSAEKIKEKIEGLNPHKVIMFGLDFAKHLGLAAKEQVYSLNFHEKRIECAIVTSLQGLLLDKAAKRRAWDLLQHFA